MSTIPSSRKQARLVSRDGAQSLELGEGAVPRPGPRQVLVRIEAASLNFRDLLALRGQLGPVRDGLVPLSDGAGTVAALGAQASRWTLGDRVVPLFFPDWIGGPFRRSYFSTALGAADADGVLAEFVVVPEDALVRMPDGLSFAEAATLPCAAVTAWHALFARGCLQAGDTVLVQGTGGVALFGLQFAVAQGARVIVTSSSDTKLEHARALGAWGTVNYRTHPDWDIEVKRLTGGEGVSHVLELGGVETFERSLKCLAAGGRIAQVGVLTGFGASPNLQPLMFSNADISGIAVGSGEHFAAMNAFIVQHGIRPIVDRVFALDEVGAAYDHLASGSHFGKVVIALR